MKGGLAHKLQHVSANSDCWLLFFAGSLLDGNSGFVRTDSEGENITYGCSNTVYGRQKFLCRGDCTKEEDILIETEENQAHNGRYSIEYIKGSAFGLHVTITHVIRSDTGRYRCGYGRPLSPDSYRSFPIIVIEGEFLLKMSLHNLLHSMHFDFQMSERKRKFVLLSHDKEFVFLLKIIQWPSKLR